MRVDVQRRGRFFMAEKFLHLFDCVALIDEQTACGMPEIVKANFWQVIAFQNLLKSPAHILSSLSFSYLPVST